MMCTMLPENNTSILILIISPLISQVINTAEIVSLIPSSLLFQGYQKELRWDLIKQFCNTSILFYRKKQEDETTLIAPHKYSTGKE